MERTLRLTLQVTGSLQPTTQPRLLLWEKLLLFKNKKAEAKIRDVLVSAVSSWILSRHSVVFNSALSLFSKDYVSKLRASDL